MKLQHLLCRHLSVPGSLRNGELEDGTTDYTLAVDMPDDLAMDQPLAPFLTHARASYDPIDPAYALNIISAAEATLEDPRQYCVCRSGGNAMKPWSV